jgi:choline kinase
MPASSTTGLILAAGRGARVAAVAAGVPKGLLDLGPCYPLQWTISTMLEAGVRPVRIVVGFKAADIEYRLRSDFSTAPLIFISKGGSHATDTAASFAVGTAGNAEPVLVAYSDTMISRTALANMLNDPRPNVLLVDKTRPYEDMDIKVVLERDRVVAVHKEISAEAAQGEATCVYRFSPPFAQKLSEECHRRLGYCRQPLWFETVLQDVLPSVHLGAVYCSSKDWCEIDVPGDLNRAKEFLSVHLGGDREGPDQIG